MLCCFAILASYVAVFMIGLCLGAIKRIKQKIRFIWYLCVYIMVSIYAMLHWWDFVKEGASVGNLMLMGLFLILTVLPFMKSVKIGQVEGAMCDFFGELVVQKQEIESMSKTGRASNPKAKKDQDALIKEIERVA